MPGRMVRPAELAVTVRAACDVALEVIRFVERSPHQEIGLLSLFAREVWWSSRWKSERRAAVGES